MLPYRIDFSTLPWESPVEGVRHKVSDFGGRRVRLVEYRPDMELHWCERGHWGTILEGRFEIELPTQTLVFGPGDGVCLPPGHEHRHRARVLDQKVVALFVEDV